LLLRGRSALQDVPIADLQKTLHAHGAVLSFERRDNAANEGGDGVGRDAFRRESQRAGFTLKDGLNIRLTRTILEQV